MVSLLLLCLLCWSMCVCVCVCVLCGKDRNKGAVQEPQSFAGALPKGNDLNEPDVQHALRLSADPLPIRHEGAPVWQDLEKQEEGPVHEIRSLLCRSKSKPSRGAPASAVADAHGQTKPGAID
ncbi:hypothetical protein DUNSADRAFT_7581 [Dunaliella salina]|uniref:Encoded protein n=1 Tax=Dunaliella salina TaxID=3046 RepID=A0ABQ7GL21_DUNSA|nr:hypothetical protein DUNSADRAFT_7581 [Dunaliella salina]|eukprot:KAF5835301.1 hypothetical protein DUNSADRAFT_7581 [Dunaliella salina]